jgi:uncharacterized protein (TIGR02466 family)
MHYDLFPTRIHAIQNFLEEKEFEEIKLLVKEDKKNLDVPDFESKVEKHVETICYDLGVDLDAYDRVEVTETWGNVLNRGDDHPIHNHSNHIFSGVFYLTDGNPTVFMDPRPAADCFSLRYREGTQCFYEARVAAPAVPNTLVIFPSWLSHLVTPNKTEKVRKSISFNIILRGHYGQPNSLQECRI